MTKLRLHPADSKEPRDTIPFPGGGTTRPGKPWRPRLVGEGEFPDAPMDAVQSVEAAMKAVEQSFLKLRKLVDEDDCDDRPRAA